ncbi:MAG: hypothetical protein WAX04_02980 [Oscillospiraceae bacterium]
MVLKSKKAKIIILSASIIISIVILSMIVSYTKFEVVNPISTGIGLAKITFTDTEYVELQESPKVIISKSDKAQDNLINYMRNRGFSEITENRLGSVLLFTNNDAQESIQFSVNRYYSKWRWQ